MRTLEKCGLVAGVVLAAGCVWAQEPQKPAVRLIETSVNVLVAAGSSTESGETLEGLQGGGHDPNRRGFTLQQAEVSFAGAIDPYLTGEAHVVFLEDDTELEEAFFRTTALRGGLELKAGYYLTEFGRHNATHAHLWPWIDQPVINTRLLGADGARSAGARVSWLVPLPWYSELYAGVQNADDNTLASFLGEASHEHGDEANEEHEDEDGHVEGEGEFEEGVGGLPRVGGDPDELLYSLRWQNGLSLGPEASGLTGVSLMSGPNTAGSSTRSTLYGVDLTLKWRPVQNQRGYPFVTWQTELMHREYEVDAETLVLEDGDELAFPGEDLKDSGLYSQVLYGFRPGWEVGIRGEYATGDGEGLESRDEDSLRDDRVRVSPLVQYRPSEFSRIRVQYNYDQADHLEDDDAHSVWIGGAILFGMHPAHTYFDACGSDGEGGGGCGGHPAAPGLRHGHGPCRFQTMGGR